MPRLPALVLLLAPLLCAFPACGDGPESDSEPASEPVSVEVPDAPVAAPDEDVPNDVAYGTCVAFKGNGPRLPAHFGALARLVEHHGLIGGVAGGSSGSISSYLVDSVQANPALYDCGDVSCTPEEQGLRAALLFKTLPQYLYALRDTQEGRALGALQQIVARAQDAGVPGLLTSDPLAGVAALRDVLGSESFRSMVNDEALDLITSGPARVKHARDLWEIARSGLAFEAPDDRIFLVPGLVDFREAARRIGRIGGFYAGWTPVDGARMQEFVDFCAEPLRGQTWDEGADVAVDGGTCRDLFDALVTDYLAHLDAAPSATTWPNRVDLPVGETMPALAVTAVIEGPSAQGWRDARADWLAGDEWELVTRWDDVRAGWWGYAGDRDLVAANAGGFDDEKSRRAVDLGESTWLDVLSLSPAEPGLARGFELPDGRVSVGGWGDPAPVQALRAIGCEEVAFVNRRGDTGWFVRAVSEHLGMTEEDERVLWDADVPGSGVWSALDDADAIWCADWDRPNMMDHNALFADGWIAPVASVHPVFTEAPNPIPSLAPFVDEEGCGVAPEVAIAGTLSCGETITGDNTSGSRVLDGYSCRPGNYASPEMTYLFVAERSETVTFVLEEAAPAVLNHDLFLLEGENGRADACLEVGFNELTAEVEAGQTYTVVVDGNGAESMGAFTLRLDCGVE